MTQDEIINIAVELGYVFMDEYANAYLFLEDLPEIVTAALAAEREACAQIAKDWDASHPHTNYGLCISNAIRARGEQ